VDLRSLDDDLDDEASFAPQSHVRIEKEIRITGAAEVNNVSQRFSQVPEPSTLVLFGIGALALFGRTWKRCDRRQV
jgi:PEP-CTERM motif